MTRPSSMSKDHLNFVFFFAVNKVWWQSKEIGAMLQGFLIGCEKEGMEDRMDLPLGGDLEVEGCAGDDFFHFEGTGSFHLEFLRSIHVEVGSLKPDFIPYFPWSKLGGYPLFHFLLGHLVGSLGIVMSSG